MSELTAALATILLSIRESAIRAKGYVGHPDEIKQLRYEMSMLLEKVDKLLDTFDKETSENTYYHRR